jgi:hypothetical protein
VGGIVWSAVIAASCAAAACAVALIGGSDSGNLAVALGLAGVVAALLNLQD